MSKGLKQQSKLISWNGFRPPGFCRQMCQEWRRRCGTELAQTTVGTGRLSRGCHHWREWCDFSGLPAIQCRRRWRLCFSCNRNEQTRMVQLPATAAIEYVAACCRTRTWTRTKTKTKTETKTRTKIRSSYGRKTPPKCRFCHEANEYMSP